MSDADLAARALALWDLPQARLTLAAQRENVVFRVDSPQGAHALRLHRPGMRQPAEIAAELDFMATLAQAGLCVPVPVPVPVPDRQGGLWRDLEGRLVDLLLWVPGQPLDPAQPVAQRAECYRALGREMARLHRAADDWTVPAGFQRHAWDLDGLTGAQPFWGRPQDHPGLDDAQRDLLDSALATARRQLQAASPDYGLIHADLVIENVLYDRGQPWLIDFDDFGWGYRLFDLATTLWRAEREPDFPAMRKALIAGYLQERDLDLALLDTVLMLRALTYLGWIVPRLDEPGAQERSARFVESALRHARGVLG